MEWLLAHNSAFQQSITAKLTTLWTVAPNGKALNALKGLEDSEHKGAK